jgi:hypothetical protein
MSYRRGRGEEGWGREGWRGRGERKGEQRGDGGWGEGWGEGWGRGGECGRGREGWEGERRWKRVAREGGRKGRREVGKVLGEIKRTVYNSNSDLMNRKPQQAWELYLKMETSADSFNLLQLIANDCYKMGQFLYSAKAFDVLERLDPNPEYWEGKRGACVGVLQLVIAGHEPKDNLKEVVQILRNTSQPQAELIVVAIRKWARENRVTIAGLTS